MNIINNFNLETIILILGIIAFARIFSSKIDFIENIKFKYKLYAEYHPTNQFKYIIYKLLNCAHCQTFWLTLIFTQNILYSMIAFIISEFINKKLDK